MLKKLGFALLIGLATAGSAQADTVVYSSPAYATFVTAESTNEYCSGCAGSGEVSDIFTLTSAASLTGVDLGIKGQATSPFEIELNIWNTDFTTNYFSQTLSFENPTSVLSDNGDQLISAVFSRPNLAAGTYRMSWFYANQQESMYILSYADPSGAIARASSGRIADAEGPKGILYPDPPEGAAFQVWAATNAIPEPETYAMLLAGLGLLGFMTRRVKQKTA